LDYIFYTPSTLTVRNWQVVEAAAQASDHLPVMATLERLKNATVPE
jgi:endonuclease/exonuclease/phosphatase family metal-dependent hydrolase